jgi:hypothetical protein
LPQLVLIDDDFRIAFELSLFASNIRREVCGVLDFFLSFLRKFEEKKAHNMLSLMLDPKFKSFCLVSSFVGQEESVNIVDEYDRRTLYPMLLKCYHHLHAIIKSTRCVNQTSDEDSSLDIFQ